MKISGIHCYAGGFALGVQRVPHVKFIGSFETYEQSQPLARVVGIKRIPAAVQADVVIANPPCSRFSAQSASGYTAEQRSDLSTFCELKEVIEYAKASHAKVLWWETGPLAATSGLDMIAAAAKRWHAITKSPVTTLIIKLDCLWTGLPQRRRRTHVIHISGPTAVIPGILSDAWNTSTRVQAFCADHTRGVRNDPCVCWAPKHGGFLTNPVKFTRAVRKANVGFKSSYPVLFDKSTPFTPSIVGAKQFAWVETNSWWGLADYAAVMDYPVDADWYDIFERKQKWPHVVGLMAQSVSPSASEWVAKNVLLPVLGEGKERGSIHPVEISKRTYMYTAVNTHLFLDIPYKHG